MLFIEIIIISVYLLSLKSGLLFFEAFTGSLNKKIFKNEINSIL